MKRALILCAFFGLLIAVIPAAASAQCTEACQHKPNPDPPPPFKGFECVEGTNEDCNADEEGCDQLLCPAPVALLDELGRATMTLEFCPSLNDGELVFADIVVADPEPNPAPVTPPGKKN